MAKEVGKETQLSDKDTASSVQSHGYICTICFKVFQTGQALGGHQSCHILERSMRPNTPNILASVLNHPLPGDEYLHLSLASGLKNTNDQKPTLPIESNQDEPKQMIGLRGGGDEGGGHRLKLPCKRKETETTMRRRMTKNLIGEWELKTFREEIWSNENKYEDVPKVGDPIELELRLTSNRQLDLELKLGFN